MYFAVALSVSESTTAQSSNHGQLQGRAQQIEGRVDPKNSVHIFASRRTINSCSSFVL
jgi:hypothetical protein